MYRNIKKKKKKIFTKDDNANIKKLFIQPHTIQNIYHLFKKHNDPYYRTIFMSYTVNMTKGYKTA